MKHPAWLVFYGTQTAIVRAASEKKAWVAFNSVWAPSSPFGHYVRPGREEVTIRRPRESDRGWIEDSGDSRFLDLLSELVAP